MIVKKNELEKHTVYKCQFEDHQILLFLFSKHNYQSGMYKAGY